MRATINKALTVFFFVILSTPGITAQATINEINHVTPPALTDTAQLSAFMDGVIEAYMEEHKVAGATAAIVHQGNLLYRKGYGYANIERGIPVDPEKTLFRIGSISKLFTWLSVLQQVEQGRLDLDADINRFLDTFTIPGTFEEPVTLRSLMSHTPGFEDILLRLFVREEDPIPTLEEIFTEQMPRRIMPPMKEAAYSNHGTGLAQYLVEQSSGLPFETYAEENIFKPLGLHHTTFRQPVPDHLASNMATGYAYRDGRYTEQGFEMIPMAGAVGASTTATDMAVFMNVLLDHARKDTISLMDSATFAIMKEPVLIHAKGMNPALHGFMDMSANHVKMIGHGGNTFLFHSLLVLFPEHHAGMFLSFSGEGGGGTYMKVLEHFMERYFPNPGPPPTSIILGEDYLQGFAGRYLFNRRPHSDILKVIGLMNAIQIDVEGDKLAYRDPFGQTHFMPAIDSTTFYVERTNSYVGFYRPVGEKAQKVYLQNYPIMAGERATPLYTPEYHLAIFFLALLCIAYIMAIWPWIYFLRRHYEKRPRTRQPVPLFHKTAAWIVALFFLLFYLSVLVASGGTEIIYGIPSLVRIGLVFPIAAIPFLLLMIWNSYHVWKMPRVKNLGRLFYNLATIVFVLALWQLYFFNMLGWRF